jgi:outer membrane receptor protein involved in Fe transport
MLYGLTLLASSLLTPAEPVDRLVVRAKAPQRPAFDAPISVSVIEEDITGFLSPRAPAELLNRAAGVGVQAGSGREHLTSIRSPVLTGGAGAGSFLFLSDGVPLRAPGFANVNGLFHAGFAFADRVVVVRGPGDVGYGSGALHGAIDVRTPAPGASPREAVLSAGSFDRYRATLQTAGGGAAFGLNVLSDGGYRAASGALDIHGRFAAEIAGGTLRVAYHHLEQETAGYILGDDAFEDDALRRSNPNPEAFRDSRHLLASFERPFRIGAWEGQVKPFIRAADMEFRLHFLPGDALEENEHTSLGVQTQAFRQIGSDLELALGFDADASEGELREFQEAPTVFSFVQGLHYDYVVQSLDLAPFAKATYALSDRIEVEGGVRYTSTFYDYDNRTDTGVVGRFRRPGDREDSFGALTGKLAAFFELTPAQGAYASLSRGARAPQTAELYRIQANQDPAGIEPETLDSFELGYRYGGPGSSLAVTAFAMRKQNVFFRDADGFNVTDGETTHLGVEAEAQFDLSPAWSAAFAGTYAEHRYAFDRNVGNASETITDGDLVDTAPKTLASFRLLYDPAGPWRSEAAVSHVGRYAMDAANTEFYDGHETVDLRLSRDLSERSFATLIVRNLLDERFARRADFAFGNERFFPGEERAFELVVAARF